jgi:hypothetical protein
MSYRNEKQMYFEVRDWLFGFLKCRHRRHKIIVEITPQTKLYRWLEKKGLHIFFKDYLTYDIKVDVLGLIHSETKANLAFVECKLNPISLMDVSQLLGYSRVALPKYSIIVSPEYISRPIAELLLKYSRFDVLSYGENNKVRIAKWDSTRKTISIESLLPLGEHL